MRVLKDGVQCQDMLAQSDIIVQITPQFEAVTAEVMLRSPERNTLLRLLSPCILTPNKMITHISHSLYMGTNGHPYIYVELIRK
jgi:hypothetical protein